MAKIVLTDAKITINSVILSSSISSVTLDTKEDVIETTGFGAAGGAKTRVGGLLDNSVTFEFFQDFAASNTEATIYPLISTVVPIVVQPTSAVVGATNPTYSFNAVVSEWSPLKGGIGALATVSVSWPISGAITKAVA